MNYWYKPSANGHWAVHNWSASTQRIMGLSGAFWILALRKVQLRYAKQFWGGLVILHLCLPLHLYSHLWVWWKPIGLMLITYCLLLSVAPLECIFTSRSKRRNRSTREVRLITRIFFPGSSFQYECSLDFIGFPCILCAMLILLLIYKIPLSINMLTIPILLLFTMVLSIGVGIIFAAWMFTIGFTLRLAIRTKSGCTRPWRILPNWSPKAGPGFTISTFGWNHQRLSLGNLGTTDFPLKSLIYSIPPYTHLNHRAGYFPAAGTKFCGCNLIANIF